MSPTAKRKPPKINTLGWRIHQVRKAWGWTQADLAAKLNAGQQLVSHWEKNINVPSSTSLLALANLFGVTVEALESGRGFTIPDIPPPRESQDPAIATIDFEVLTRAVPAGVLDRVVLIDIHAREASTVSGSKAKQHLDEARKKGRLAWVVIL